MLDAGHGDLGFVTLIVFHTPRDERLLQTHVSKWPLMTWRKECPREKCARCIIYRAIFYKISRRERSTQPESQLTDSAICWEGEDNRRTCDMCCQLGISRWFYRWVVQSKQIVAFNIHGQQPVSCLDVIFFPDLRMILKSMLVKAWQKEARFKNYLPGSQWYQSFMKKKKLVQRLSQNLAHKQAQISTDDVTAYFASMQRSIQDVPPENIWTKMKPIYVMTLEGMYFPW